MTELSDQNQVQDTVASEPVNLTPVDTTQEIEKKEDVRVEEFRISGDTLVTKVKEFIHQGNIRRIIIKNEEGNTLIEIPLTIGVVGGVVGAAVFPVIAALGVIGAMVTHLTVVVEKKV